MTFISGYNFARNSDVVFSEVLPNLQIYITDEFELDSGQIIFCKIDYVQILLNLLKDEQELLNIKLITHEGDIGVGEKLFLQKPKCISKWYAQNVEYEHPDLIPIPIGIANDYCQITLKFEDIKSNMHNVKNKKLLYINHRNSTNPHLRTWIYDYFETNNWCTVDEPNLSLDQYRNKLDNHKFILCPRGNGIDTHRLWESLYHGIIPIVEDHIHYSCLKGLPVLVVKSFKEISENFLIEQLDEISKKPFNMDKLNISWWINFIKQNN